MRNRITLILIFTCGIIYGQEENNYTRIYTNVLQNIDISHPFANIGIEKDFNGNQSLSFGLGLYYRNWMYNESTNGINLGLEYKRFANEKLYFSLGFSGGKLNYNTTGSFKYGDLDSIYSESIKIDKIVCDFYLKVGFRKDLGQHFYFDYFAGLGARYKETVHKERTRPNDEYQRGFYLVDIRDNPGKFFYPVLKLGIVIGLKI
ncbi:MAG: hypothetical protein M0R21_07780 [Lentimicrobiaceae bacterium]|nr:hypothetical protein [Lentimicrobiaceae bacterium]